MSRGSIFLIGFMGCGKSTLGRRLAEALGRDFVDTDERVERREGSRVEEIFRDSGEARFRQLEREVLEGLSGEPPAVVATGGGLFAEPVAREIMRRTGRTIWLDAPLAECMRRVGGGSGRPLWKQDSLEFRAFFEMRRATYALADLRVDASAQDFETVLARLVAAVKVFR